MTPEEQFIQETWELLQRVKYAHITNPRWLFERVFQKTGGRGFELWLPYGDSNHMQTRNLIYKFAEWKILRVLDVVKIASNQRYTGGLQLFVEILNPEFEQIYDLYKNGLEQQIPASQLLKMVKDWVHPTTHNMPLSTWELIQGEKPDDNNENQPSIADGPQQPEPVISNELLGPQETIKPVDNKIVCSIEQGYSHQIVINGKYLLTRPQGAKVNDLVFSYLIQHPNHQWSRKEVEEAIGQPTHKSFNTLVNQLKFTGVLRKLFFPVGSKAGIEFRNPVTKADLNRASVTKQELEGHLKTLTKLLV